MKVLYIQIDGGGTFDGDAEQLDDCFGISARRPLTRAMIEHAIVLIFPGSECDIIELDSLYG